MLTQVPAEIFAEVIREQDRIGYPDGVPAWAEIPRRRGGNVWKGWKELHIGDCEQLVEHHKRKAVKAIERYLQTGSRATVKTAGHHILYARIYRCRVFELMGADDFPESEMPFPITNRS